MSHFTIPYAEYDISALLQKALRPTGASVSIPFSRQQKGYDLVIANSLTHRAVTVQVKSSRAYLNQEPGEPTYEFWFKRFETEENPSDYFALYMSYPILDADCRPGAKWGRKVLLLRREEMADLLSAAKTKAGKQSGFFGLSFSSADDHVAPSRSLEGWRGNFEGKLLQDRLELLSQSLSN